MIIELIGPGGVGKTTLEPMVAERLGLEHHPSRKRHALSGQPLTPAGLWLQRLGTTLGNPALFVRSAMAMKGGGRARLRFALDISRREQIARRAAIGGGVVASGTLHAICAASANHHIDLNSLVTLVTPADLYVFLTIDPAEATRRLADRLVEAGLDADLEDHSGIQQRYASSVGDLKENIGSPILEVDAGGTPEEVVREIVFSIEQAVRS